MSTFTVKKNIDRATQFAGDNFGKAMQNKTKLSFTTYNDQTVTLPLEYIIQTQHR